MAMVGVRPTCPSVCVCHAWTERQSKRVFGIGKKAWCSEVAGVSAVASAVYHGASRGLSPSSEVCLVLKVIGTTKGSGICGVVAGRGLWDAQEKEWKSRDRVFRWWCCVGSSGEISNSEDESPEGIERERGDDEEVEQALQLDGQIPTTSDGFLKRVSSGAYDLRRQFEQNVESSSYDVPRPSCITIRTLKSQSNSTRNHAAMKHRGETELDNLEMRPSWDRNRDSITVMGADTEGRVLDTNPWRETPKAVYVLAQEENRLLTMRTRRARSEVERELGKLFPKRGSRRGRQGKPSSKRREEEQSGLSPSSGSESDSGFRMHVEDIREGVLVFEDEDEATRYCSLLDGEGKNCAGVAELDASDVFAVCQKTQRLAVLFRRGTTPPQPDRLQLNLKARKRSLEDQS